MTEKKKVYLVGHLSTSPALIAAAMKVAEEVMPDVTIVPMDESATAEVLEELHEEVTFRVKSPQPMDCDDYERTLDMYGVRHRRALDVTPMLRACIERPTMELKPNNGNRNSWPSLRSLKKGHRF